MYFILFTAWGGNKFLLLRHFEKGTENPRREIEQAEHNSAGFIVRSKEDE
jgi:phage-related protein